jgi:15-cis-phytoene desaturase
MTKAVIAGGGLAGLACAKRLLDAGFEVVLVEAAPWFGGRATSWIDPVDGQEIESGIHSLFGIYSHLCALLREVGVTPDWILKWEDAVAFLHPGPRYHVFGINPVLALPQVVGGLLGNNRYVGPWDKLGVGRAVARGLRRRRAYAYETVQGLAYESGVTRVGYELVMRPLMRSLFFLDPEDLAAYAPLTLARHVLVNPASIRAGTFKGGMGELMITPLVRWLERHGAVLRTDAPVRAFHHAEGELDLVRGFELEGGEVVRGDVVVSALPLEVLQGILPPSWAAIDDFAKLQQIETVPAISVQLWFDIPLINKGMFLFVPDSPIAILQDQSFTTFPREGSRISCQVVDRATDGYTDQQLIDLVREQLVRFLPLKAGAHVEKAAVVRHRAFAMRPGIQSRRPTQASPVPGFYLAGDYTRQDWFITMEGAVRSGEMAAACIVTASGRPRP